MYNLSWEHHLSPHKFPWEFSLSPGLQVRFRKLTMEQETLEMVQEKTCGCFFCFEWPEVEFITDDLLTGLSHNEGFTPLHYSINMYYIM